MPKALLLLDQLVDHDIAKRTRKSKAISVSRNGFTCVLTVFRWLPVQSLGSIGNFQNFVCNCRLTGFVKCQGQIFD